MNTYKLGLWKIIISYYDDEKYNVICDGKSLVILNITQDFLTFVKLDVDNDKLVLEKLPYYLRYVINHEDKTLEIIVT